MLFVLGEPTKGHSVSDTEFLILKDGVIKGEIQHSSTQVPVSQSQRVLSLGRGTRTQQRLHGDVAAKANLRGKGNSASVALFSVPSFS